MARVTGVESFGEAQNPQQRTPNVRLPQGKVNVLGVARATCDVKPYQVMIRYSFFLTKSKH